ncbi:Two component system response regulator/histidine kinase [Desulfonema limicola]|uniref:Two component system response regulator/histidine kinase n=1 Tax=Desulfonema limicola TaxID=45656 RepID=A0A975GGK4_9BACT|nr:serine/threonine-protein kinase [Desulfonema limicola]QTA80430.1 Two component system response regulator/histidine kinase [Desulfonema limicola]
MTIDEYVLLVCLKPEEVEHIRQLLSSFEIKIDSKDIHHFDDAKACLKNENICLAVLRLDKKLSRPDQDIIQLRQFLPDYIPILILISHDLTQNIKDYIKAGANDYWVLPLDNTSFSVRFYVLLEFGQSIILSEKAKGFEIKHETSLLQRIIEKIQDSLRFFSPNITYKHENNSSIAEKWIKIKKLGFGGFGEVWLVKRHGKGMSAVAKIPHSSKLNTRALRAAAILKRLSIHPNIVHLIEVVEEDGKVVLIQEYIPGLTLQQLIENTLNGKHKEDYFLQLLSVASHAHQNRIMHRDIKPENIIITPSGTLKLLDFGIAKDLSRHNIGKTIAGSRPFMAPEQIMGKSSIASDVWSLGVILYIFATNTLPFYDPNEKYLMDLILETSPLPPRKLEPGLPENFETLILKCLDKNPENRYQDAGELRQELLELFPLFGDGSILPDNYKD